MLEFKKGYPENLEGKAVVYAKIYCETKKAEKCEKCPAYLSKEDIFFAAYASNNILEYMEKMGAPEEIIENAKGLEKSLLNLLEKEGRKTSGKMPMFAAPFNVESEQDLLLGQEDVIYLGEYSSLSRALISVKSAVELYVSSFQEQVEKKHGVDSDEGKQENPITYKDFAGESIRNYIIENFIIPMVNVHTGIAAHKNMKSIKRDFIRFSATAPFFSDVLDLCDAIEKSPIVINTDLTDAYINKIVAIHKEDYTIAAEMRDKIKEIKDSS